MAIRLRIEGDDVAAKISSNLAKHKQRIAKALGAATQQLADNILKEGRADIASAGKFGTRWTQGFTANVDGKGLVYSITFRHAVPYWRTHQYGALIRGKPLLWIPLPS